ncbi:hypothetical protein [Hymenobacter chitinivorans]|uniref:Outer membrane protein with beta-barrel domain n=1 Tax=Hymenobacter chitinivorans DSM 11115 TaxID=1121954 RepID=A0A2M9BLH4_9BACT|nr:hypothetical protein [Hymenobacter chitinivorans]PJJ58775.1 hypothetical protein CLV45_0185 [Hymenobacter chitinivorans DSM 11115]
MSQRVPSFYYLLVACCALSSCSVYAPMLPAAPQIRDKGQAEVQATSFLNGRWEAGATYSPLRHVLVRAAGGIKTDSRDTAYFRVHQYEVGLGGYYPLGKHWLVTGLGGYGQARSNRGYYQTFLFGNGYLVDFKANYRRVFGELSTSYYNSWVTLGLAYRLSKVDFTSLTYNGAPLGMSGMLREEAMLFARFGSEEGSLSWLGFQVSLGTTAVPRSRPEDQNTNPYAREYDHLRESRILMGASLIVYPHRLRKSFKPE